VMQIINGNALDELKKLPDGSVDCVITSPPYYGLRSYKGAEMEWEDWKGQLGLEPTYQMYLGHLLMITRELKRVLKDTGTLFWNMSDSYAGKMGKRQGWNDNKIAYTREEALENGTSFYLDADYGNIQDKSLMMIPERFAIGMIDQGWILRNKIIWRKGNAMPSSVHDRFSNKWEYIFFFVQSKKYYFDLDAVRKPLADPDRMLRDVSGKRHSSAVALDAFMGNLPKGISKPRPNIRQKYEKEGGGYVGKHSGYFNTDGSLRANLKGANPGDVIDMPLDVDDFLDIPTRPHTFAHFAVYPETLIEPLIRAGCPPNGVVLDPFAGSGTTGIVAERLGRNSILIEISSEYIGIINERLRETQ